MKKTYPIRLIPTKTQIRQIDRTLGCVRFVYNHFLDRRSTEWKDHARSLSTYDCQKELTQLKKDLPWLSEVDKFALQNANFQLGQAFDNFFRDNKKARKRRSRYPQFKRKHASHQSYRTNITSNNIRVHGNRIRLPKLGWVKFRHSQDIPEGIIAVTVVRTATGHYEAKILCETEIRPWDVPENNAIGLDFGIKAFLTTSDGFEIESPKYYRRAERKLRKANMNLHRKVRGSKNRAKARTKLARVHEKIANLRKDFLEKLSTDLIRHHRVVCIEDLNLSGMVRNHHLSKSLLDSGWGMFALMLERKADWHGRSVVKVDPFFPSSQLCSDCGARNSAVKDLSIRSWTCSECGVVHDRDENAAQNILREGLRLLAVGATERVNARGECVSPGSGQAILEEAGISRLQS